MTKRIYTQFLELSEASENGLPDLDVMEPKELLNYAAMHRKHIMKIPRGQWKGSTKVAFHRAEQAQAMAVYHLKLAQMHSEKAKKNRSLAREYVDLFKQNNEKGYGGKNKIGPDQDD